VTSHVTAHHKLSFYYYYYYYYYYYVQSVIGAIQMHRTIMMMMMMSVRPLCRTDGVRHLLICCTVSIVPPRCERRPRRRGVGSMLLRRLRSSGGWSLKRTGNGRTASVARRYLATRWARVLSTVASTELRLERDLRRIRKGPFSYYISTPPSPCIASYNTCDTSPKLKLYNTGQSSPP